MSLTLDEIKQQQGRLQAEIAERECGLAILKALHDYAVGGRNPQTLDSNLLRSVFTGSTSSPLQLNEAANEKPVVRALPPPPPVKRYIHPELETPDYRRLHGRNGKLVQWAIARMTEDFSLRDIAALLHREGSDMGLPEISVVLTRLKGRGEIQEVRRGNGRTPTIFAKPASAAADQTPIATDMADQNESPVSISSEQ